MVFPRKYRPFTSSGPVNSGTLAGSSEVRTSYWGR
jgi:hypothetical protein